MRILTTLSSLKTCAAFVSAEDDRYYLNGVYVEVQKLVGTDGHRMAILKPTVWIAEGFKKPFIIPYGAITQLKAKCKKHETAYVLIEKNSLSIGVTDCEVKTLEDFSIIKSLTVAYEPIDGTFPDYNRCIPSQDRLTGELPEGSSFNTAYMSVFEKFNSSATVFFTDNVGPALLTAKNEDFEAVGLLMPMRGHGKQEIPNWLYGKTA
jgi:DNA polymerase III sliding clamp (beta) subunit (PCNA family)